MTETSVFAAVSNSTRRGILDLLRKRRYSAGELVSEFSDLPQPAVSRHLRVLRDAGLVHVSKESQRRVYSLRADRLIEIDEWISTYRKFWTDRLDSLAAHLDQKMSAKNSGKSDVE